MGLRSSCFPARLTFRNLGWYLTYDDVLHIHDQLQLRAQFGHLTQFPINLLSCGKTRLAEQTQLLSQQYSKLCLCLRALFQ